MERLGEAQDVATAAVPATGRFGARAALADAAAGWVGTEAVALVVDRGRVSGTITRQSLTEPLDADRSPEVSSPYPATVG